MRKIIYDFFEICVQLGSQNLGLSKKKNQLISYKYMLNNAVCGVFNNSIQIATSGEVLSKNL